jgi:DNA-binding NarL/FixJ family response regulator
MINAGVAERLVRSPKTIRNCTTSIFGTLQVADGAEAIVGAREAGRASLETRLAVLSGG